MSETKNVDKNYIDRQRRIDALYKMSMEMMAHTNTYTATMPKLTNEPKWIPRKFDPKKFGDKPRLSRSQPTKKYNFQPSKPLNIGLDLVTMKPFDEPSKKVYEDCRSGLRDSTLIDDIDIELYFEEEDLIQRQNAKNTNAAEAEKQRLEDETEEVRALEEIAAQKLEVESKNNYPDYRFRDYRLKVAKESFEKADKVILEHPETRFKLKDVTPLLPDMRMCKYKFDHLIFQSELKSVPDIKVASVNDLMVFKGIVETKKRGAVQCFIPVDSITNADIPVEVEAGTCLQYEHPQMYQYQLLNQPEDKAEKNYLIVKRDDAHCFIPIDTK
ncbi:hypothetical protein ACOME3_003737 [Neoechinorhynchus agilis]